MNFKSLILTEVINHHNLSFVTLLIAAKQKLGLFMAFSWFLLFNVFSLYMGAVFLQLKAEYWWSVFFIVNFWSVF